MCYRMRHKCHLTINAICQALSVTMYTARENIQTLVLEWRGKSPKYLKSHTYSCIMQISDAITKLRNATVSMSRPSVWPSVWNYSALTGRVFMKFHISKIYFESASFIKIWQEHRVLYIETCVHLWYYLAEFFLDWEMFQTKVVKKVKTQFYVK